MTPSAPNPNLIGVKLGNYRLERELGRGRMGVVYLARDEALLRPTAVKILAWAFPEPQGYDPEAWFLAEARTVARVNHPSVIQVYGVAKHGTYCYIAMEYVDGVPADRVVADGGPLDSVAATSIVLQIAGGLHAAHACEVIHRDIKPANILIRADGTAKLGDFGMALHPSGRHAAGNHERVGTPQYTAPEIWRLEPATPATDLYALGATYYFLLTGRPPFHTRDLATMIAAHLNAPIPDPRDIVSGIASPCAEVVRRCLAKSPLERFESVQLLAWELRGALRALGSPSVAPPAPTSESKLSSEPPSRILGTPSSESWTSYLGLARSPFSDLSAECTLESFEPFGEVARQLRANLSDHPGATIVLTGDSGSGHSQLVREMIGSLAGSGPVALLDMDEGAGVRSLVPRACCAFGTVASPHATTGRHIEALIEHLGHDEYAGNAVAILVVEGLPPTPREIAELLALGRAAWTTKYLSIVVLGAPGLAELLLRAAGTERATVSPSLRSLTVPPLDPRQTLDYLQRMLLSVRTPGRPPVVLTPDAAFIVAHRSGGNLSRVNRFAATTLQHAAMRHSRVASSWDAWMALENEQPLARSSQANQRVEGPTDWPPDWPPGDVLEVLNAARAKAGLPRRASRD